MDDLHSAKEISSDFPDYYITNTGDVFSRKYGKIKKLKNFLQNGYFHITLLNKFGQKKTMFIHRLVLMAFDGIPIYPNNIGRHLDGNPQNNHISNLKWGTSQDNSNDARLHGRIAVGEKTNSNSLKEFQINEIFLKYANGQSIKSIARFYKVSSTAIVSVLKRRTWSHVRIEAKILEKAIKRYEYELHKYLGMQISEEIKILILEKIFEEKRVDFPSINKEFGVSLIVLRNILNSKPNEPLRKKFDLDFSSIAFLDRIDIKYDNIISIFEKYREQKSLAKLSKLFNLDKSTIRNIILGKIKNEIFVPDELREECLEILNKSRKRYCPQKAFA